MTTDAPSRIIYELLVEEMLLDWPLFYGFMPDGPPSVPDNIAAVYDTSGVKDGRIMGTGENIFHYGFQLRVRARDYDEGWTRIKGLQAVFEAIKNKIVTVGVNTYEIANITQVGPPLFLGVEDEGTDRRNLFTTNYLATLKET